MRGQVDCLCTSTTRTLWCVPLSQHYYSSFVNEDHFIRVHPVIWAELPEDSGTELFIFRTKYSLMSVACKDCFHGSYYCCCCLWPEFNRVNVLWKVVHQNEVFLSLVFYDIVSNMVIRQAWSWCWYKRFFSLLLLILCKKGTIIYCLFYVNIHGWPKQDFSVMVLRLKDVFSCC